jgi:hypothetical protein
MKKIYSYAMLLLAGAFACTSCSDDRDSNPTIAQPTEFTINNPATANGYVDLQESKTVELTWSQPVFTTFNAPVIPTYTVQLSTTGTFNKEYNDALDDNTGADFISMAETFSTCKANVSTESIDRALMQLMNWDETTVPTQLAVSIRVKAAVQDASFTEYSPVLSNIVKLNTVPYYMELKPADPEIWWLIGGDIGDGTWGDAIGQCVFPMLCVKDFEYDKKSGQGEIEWIGYLAGNGFKLRGSMTDGWATQIGQGPAFGSFLKNEGGSGNITVPEAGIYKITVNTAALAKVADKEDCTSAVTVEKYDGAAPVFTGMAISGSFNGWSDTDMKPVHTYAGAENHDWYITYKLAKGDEIKIKQAGSWDFNKGGSLVTTSDGMYAFGVDGGANFVIEEEANYLILFNDITGFVRFIKQE